MDDILERLIEMNPRRFLGTNKYINQRARDTIVESPLRLSYRDLMGRLEFTDSARIMDRLKRFLVRRPFPRVWKEDFTPRKVKLIASDMGLWSVEHAFIVLRSPHLSWEDKLPIVKWSIAQEDGNWFHHRECLEQIPIETLVHYVEAGADLPSCQLIMERLPTDERLLAVCEPYEAAIAIGTFRGDKCPVTKKTLQILHDRLAMAPKRIVSEAASEALCMFEWHCNAAGLFAQEAIDERIFLI